MKNRTPSSSSGSRSLIPLLLLLGACTAPEEERPAADDPVAWVDPFIATAGPGFRVGSAHPGPTVPFSLVKVGPDTSIDGAALNAYHCSGYYHDDTHVEGISHFRMHGVGIPDYGNIVFMPTLGWDASKRSPTGYRMGFDKEFEWARAGAYGLTLDDGITVELAGTRRAAHHRYAFPDDGEPVVVVDLEKNLFGSSLGGEIAVDAEAGVVEGHMVSVGAFTGGGFPIYFHAVFDGGIASFGTWADDEGVEGRAEAEGVDLGAWIVSASRTPTIRVGISLTSLEGARANLAAELPGQSIEGTQDEAAEAWEAAFEGFSVDGASDTERHIFWTALYHLLQMPQTHGDADGTYRGFDGELHVAEGWDYHNDFSLWDTYRTAHPAFTLLYPDKSRELARSLVAMAEQGGAFPAWPAAAGDSEVMLGAPADIVLADTYVKGVDGWGEEEAWEQIRDQARGVGEIPYNARPDVTVLEAYGYYPSDWFGASVAWLQENAWADHALAQLGNALGHPDDAARFAWRSHTWKNVYDAETGFFRGRLSDGTFSDPAYFDELEWASEYTEGNAWQYLWMPWFHWDELAETLGGREAALERLERFFAEAEAEGVTNAPATYYWHGNEPDIHAAWLFTLWGERDRTWRWNKWIAATHYAHDPHGLAGNDDAGTLSAWYLFAAFGFYPLAGTTSYVAGVPLFPEVTFPVEGGTFTSRRVGDGDHVVSVTLNGVPLTGATFRHAELVPGGVYEVVVE